MSEYIFQSYNERRSKLKFALDYHHHCKNMNVTLRTNRTLPETVV